MRRLDLTSMGFMVQVEEAAILLLQLPFLLLLHQKKQTNNTDGD